MKRLESTVPALVETARVDKVIPQLFPEISGWLVRDVFAQRDVKVNGKRVRRDACVSAGDIIEVFLREMHAVPLDICFEDDGYVIVNKRQGVPTQGPGSVEEAYAKEKGSSITACHRLDVQTGGLLLLAKNAQAEKLALDAFVHHQLTKVYQAVVCGHPMPEEAEIHAYLYKDAERARVWVLDAQRPGGVPIRTRYRTLAVGAQTATLEITLLTGRTHQIRAHLAHIGHPVLGDDKYGDRALNRRFGARRQMLWATRLVLWDGRAFEVEPGYEKGEI